MANTPLEHINYNGTTYDIQPLRLKYIVGTGTAAVTSSPYTHSKWEASAPEITELYDGLTIIYKVPVAGNGSYGTGLQINDLGYHPVVTQTNTMISTRYGVGAIILLVYTTSLSGTLYKNSGSGSTITGVWVCVNNYVDGNDTTTLRSSYSRIKTGTVGVHRNSLFAKTGPDTFDSFTTTAGNGTSKVKTDLYYDISKIFYLNSSSSYAAGGNRGSDSQITWAQSAIDIRYTINLADASGITLNQPLYLIFKEEANSQGYHQLADTWWTQTLPSSVDNKIYVLVGYIRNSSTYYYQCDVFPVNPGYIYKNGAVQIYSPVNIEGAVVGPASSIAGHIATFSGSDGTTIQDSGYTTASFAAATHTHSFASLSDTPTTLSGYGITDAATSTHTHGNLTNDGKVGSTSDYAVVTGTGGAITAKSIAVAEPTASGNTTTFIATLSQKSDGQIVLTKKTIPNASTSTAGIVQLGTGATNAAAGNHDHDSTYLKLAGGTMTGTLTLAADPTASMQAATKQYVDNSFAANDAMVFKGTIGPSGSTVTALPASHSAGDTYRVNVSATTSYAGVACENGDLIICITDGTSANNAHWTVVQTNIDGAVTGPASATGDRIATFNGTSGKVIKDSGYTTASFAASTHSHGDISSSGTVSTTAVTATNGDYILITDSSNSHKVQRGIAIGTTTTSFLANDGTWKTPVDNNTITSWYGTSATTSNTAAKTATCTNYVLNTGNLIGILFTTSNTAATPTLNVNSTGAKNIYVGNATANTTTNVLMWSANTMVFFLYDGTQYRYMGAMAAGNVEQPRGANTWYGTSNTASTTTAKASTVNNFVLTKGATVAVNFSTANTVTNTAITLNINSTGAKNIYNNNAVTSATNTVTWDANETLTFMYDGTGYHLVSRSRVASGIIMRTWTA